MSLILSGGFDSDKVTINTFGIPSLIQEISFGEYNLNLHDFLYAVYYVLTNTYLENDQSRWRLALQLKN